MFSTLPRGKESWGNYKSYFKERMLTVGAKCTLQVTCGVPLASVLSHTLRNLYYCDILEIRVPSWVYLIGYSDEMAVVVTAGCATDRADPEECRGMARSETTQAHLPKTAGSSLGGWKESKTDKC